MPTTMLRNGLTAENSIFSQKPTISVPKSRFDLSRLNALTTDIGVLTPVDLIPTLPGDTFDLDCNYQIDFRPLLTPSLTPYRVRVHYYYAAMSDLWSGWESFISKGRAGTLNLTVPTMTSQTAKYYNAGELTDSDLNTLWSVDTTKDTYAWMPHSLMSFILGQFGQDYKNTSTTLSTTYKPLLTDYTTATAVGKLGLPKIFNALPFLMYQKIYRSNYLDPNLYSNGVVKSDVWFPDDIDSSHWRFDYSASNQSNYKFVPVGCTIPTTLHANFVPIAESVDGSNADVFDNAVDLRQIRYAMYSNDMYTTALPFCTRGSEPTLEGGSFNVDAIDAKIANATSFALSDFVMNYPQVSSGGSYTSVKNYPQYSYHSADDDTKSFDNSYLGHSVESSGFVTGLRALYGGSISFKSTVPVTLSTNAGSSAISGTITLNAIRNLIALSVWQERNALTNGSYGQFIKVHYGDYPNNSYYEPRYIGGCSSTFNISSVVQTSSTTTDTDGNLISPQGNQTGLGNSQFKGSIGKFRAPDYGYIMAIMSIVPDTLYDNVNEHWVYETSVDDYYMPEFEKLSLQALQNKYIFECGNDSTDNDLYGYINRYVYLKQRPSIARGLFGLVNDSAFSPYVQRRHFMTTPKLSQQFVTCYPPNIDRSMLCVTDEPAFICQFFSSVRVNRAMSYASRPSTFGF